MNNRLWRYSIASCLLAFALFWNGATPPPTDLASVQVTEALAYCPSENSRFHNIGKARYALAWGQIRGTEKGGGFICHPALHNRQVVIYWLAFSDGRRLKLELYDRETGNHYGNGRVEKNLAAIRADIEDTSDIWVVRLAALFLSFLLFLRNSW